VKKRCQPRTPKAVIQPVVVQFPYDMSLANILIPSNDEKRRFMFETVPPRCFPLGGARHRFQNCVTHLFPLYFQAINSRFRVLAEKDNNTPWAFFGKFVKPHPLAERFGAIIPACQQKSQFPYASVKILRHMSSNACPSALGLRLLTFFTSNGEIEWSCEVEVAHY
jgi:hypothetical protein